MRPHRRLTRATLALGALLLVAALLGAALLRATAQRGGSEKPKYGPTATRLADAPEHIRATPAPDYWALSPYYVGQRDDRSCSLAAAAMVVNAARASRALGADDELATQDGLLERVPGGEWSRSVGLLGVGVTLHEMPLRLSAGLIAYGVTATTIEAVCIDRDPADLREGVRALLVENERSARDFVLVNFNQGVFTGDADAGHWAPVGAFDETRGRALILDPDRRWYEPYWVSLETLIAGMATKDLVSGKNRGLVRVRLAQ